MPRFTKITPNYTQLYSSRRDLSIDLFSGIVQKVLDIASELHYNWRRQAFDLKQSCTIAAKSP